MKRNFNQLSIRNLKQKPKLPSAHILKNNILVIVNIFHVDIIIFKLIAFCVCLLAFFVVASPDDCPLREQKIILSRSLRNNARITRDNYCQTELTLPPNLPKEVEDALRPYFTYTQNQQQPSLEFCDSPQLESNDSMSKYAAHNAGIF